MAQRLKLGIPKGSLQASTVQLFARAGFNIYIDARSYYPAIDAPQIDAIMNGREPPVPAGWTGGNWNDQPDSTPRPPLPPISDPAAQT